MIPDTEQLQAQLDADREQFEAHLYDDFLRYRKQVRRDRWLFLAAFVCILFLAVMLLLSPGCGYVCEHWGPYVTGQSTATSYSRMVHQAQAEHRAAREK